MPRLLIAALCSLMLASCAANPQAETPASAAPDAAAPTGISGAAGLLRLLDEEAGPQENVFFSPLSIDHAFGIVALGARGETADQLARVLPPPASPRAYVRDEDGVELRLANRLWVDRSYALSDDFSKAARDRYASGIETIDKDDKPGSARVMNAWAADATDGLIPEIVSPSDITRDLALFVTNAILFDGDWAQKFDDLGEQPFLFGSGKERPFLFMRERLELQTVDRDDWRAVRLPYSDARYAMDIIMPEDREVMLQAPDLALIEDLGARLGDEKPQLVDMELPRFETETEINLIPPLQSLGLTLPFDRTRADLSGIGASGARNLYVGGAKQLAKLQVFDTGTRAAAVTVVTIRVTGAPPADTRRAVPFTVDRPFILVMHDLETGALLFLGRISDPQAYTPAEGESPY